MGVGNFKLGLFVNESNDDERLARAGIGWEFRFFWFWFRLQSKCNRIFNPRSN